MWHFPHRTARNSIEIVCQCGIRQLVMIVMLKDRDPAPFPVLPNARMQREGIFVYLWDSMVTVPI